MSTQLQQVVADWLQQLAARSGWESCGLPGELQLYHWHRGWQFDIRCAVTLELREHTLGLYVCGNLLFSHYGQDQYSPLPPPHRLLKQRVTYDTLKDFELIAGDDLASYRADYGDPQLLVRLPQLVAQQLCYDPARTCARAGHSGANYSEGESAGD